MSEWIEIPGGDFLFGSEDHYKEESPQKRIQIDSFFLSSTAVTNAEFSDFVEDTGYITFAERDPKPEDYPDADPSLLQPGSAVFQKTKRPVPLDNPGLWWRWVPGAYWREPRGPGSSTREDHPVVQVAYEDALSYAKWAGGRLPSEEEWERAARGPEENRDFPGVSRMEINHWVGIFPHSWRRSPGRPRSPGACSVGTFPPSPWGLYEMCGNVWEWTSSAYLGKGESCCRESDVGVQKTLRGGSFLCADNYCSRYRVSARIPQNIDSPTNHIGFRIARDQ